MTDDTREEFGEPWRVDAEMDFVLRDASDMDLTYVDSDDGRRRDQIERAAKSVNACRGLPDPEVAIGRLVEAAKRAIEKLPHGAGCPWRVELESGVVRILDCDCGLHDLRLAAAPFLEARKGRDGG